MATQSQAKSTKSPHKRGARKAASERPSVKEGSRRLSPDERRAQLVELAKRMFGERPYAELSVREVAQAAGVTENLVYHYFTNKETLFLAAFQHADELLAACLPPRGLPLFEQFERAVKGYLDFVEANATVYLNLVHGATAGEEDVQRVGEQTRRRIAERYLEGLGVQALPAPLTRLAVRGYIGFIEEVVLRWLPKRSVPRADIERLMFAAGGATFIAALAMDGALPQGLSAEQFRKAFQRHFSLP